MAKETRPFKFLDYLPNVFRTDELTSITVKSVSGTTVTVEPFDGPATEIPSGTRVFAFNNGTVTRLAIVIPANTKGLTRIEVRDAWFAATLRAGDTLSILNLMSRFLQTFETLFEELQAAIEGTPGGILQLTANLPPVRPPSLKITVGPFDSRDIEFPAGTTVTVANKPLRGKLKSAVPANRTGLTSINIAPLSVAVGVEDGDILRLHPGGIPDLFSPDTTPPPQFRYRPRPDFNFVSFFDDQNQFIYLNYLAGWIALPLRAEKSVDWNRRFFNAAIQLYLKRSTLPGMEALLRAWLKDDLWEVSPALLILTDLTRTHNEIDAVFQLAPPQGQEAEGEVYAQLGLNTVLGEGPPFFFIADLITDPKIKGLRNPVGLDVFERAARFLLDTEKPAHTYYQLRVRAHTMQLAPPPGQEVKGEVYAQTGETTLLWDEPMVFDSDS